MGWAQMGLFTCTRKWRGGGNPSLWLISLTKFKNNQKIKFITIHQHYFINGSHIAGAQIMSYVQSQTPRKHKINVPQRPCCSRYGQGGLKGQGPRIYKTETQVSAPPLAVLRFRTSCELFWASTSPTAKWNEYGYFKLWGEKQMTSFMWKWLTMYGKLVNTLVRNPS